MIKLFNNLKTFLLSNIPKQIGQGIFWATLASVVSQGIMLCSMFITARYLGLKQYGEFAMLKSTISTFTLFAGLGIGLTTTKFISQYKNNDKVKAGKIIALAIVFTYLSAILVVALICLFATYIAAEYLNAPHLAGEIRLSSLIIFLCALNGLYNGSLIGFEAYKSVARVSIISAILFFPLQLILFKVYPNLYAALIGLAVFYLFNFLVGHFEVKKKIKEFGIKVDYFNCLDQLPILYKFTLPAFLSGIMITPVLWVCNMLIVHQVNGYKELAIFDAANQYRTAILFLPGVFSQIAIPMFSKNNKSSAFHKILKMNVSIVAVVTITVALLVFFLSEFLMNFYGKGFIGGSNVLIILSISAVLSSINSVFGQAIVGKGLMWSGFLMNFIWAFALLGFAYYYNLSSEGAMGFAKAYLYSYAIHSVIQLLFFKYHLRQKS